MLAKTQPSTPNPTLQTLVFTLLRAILALLGALGIGIGANINDGTLMVISGIVVVIVSTAWSIWEKIQAARNAHAAATASAIAGTPVKSLS